MLRLSTSPFQLCAACKFMDASGNGWISDAIRCYDYCTQEGAHIISNSWGVYATSAAMQAAALVSAARSVSVLTEKPPC